MTEDNEKLIAKFLKYLILRGGCDYVSWGFDKRDAEESGLTFDDMALLKRISDSNGVFSHD